MNGKNRLRAVKKVGHVDIFRGRFLQFSLGE